MKCDIGQLININCVLKSSSGIFVKLLLLRYPKEDFLRKQVESFLGNGKLNRVLFFEVVI